MFNNVRLFTHQLESTSDMPPLLTRAMLELRRASPLTYRALYLFDNTGNQLIHVTEPLDELLEIKDVNALLRLGASGGCDGYWRGRPPGSGIQSDDLAVATGTTAGVAVQSGSGT